MIQKLIKQSLSCFFALFSLMLINVLIGYFSKTNNEISDYGAGFIVALLFGFPIFLLISLCYEFLKKRVEDKYSIRVSFLKEALGYLLLWLVIIIVFYFIYYRGASVKEYFSDARIYWKGKSFWEKQKNKIMRFAVEILDISNTSIGQIAILKFPQGIRPSIGLTLEDESNAQWKIKGVGMNSKFLNIDAYEGSVPKTLWDCNLQLFHGNGILRKGAFLFINR